MGHFNITCLKLRLDFKFVSILILLLVAQKSYANFTFAIPLQLYPGDGIDAHVRCDLLNQSGKILESRIEQVAHNQSIMNLTIALSKNTPRANVVRYQCILYAEKNASLSVVAINAKESWARPATGSQFIGKVEGVIPK